MDEQALLPTDYSGAVDDFRDVESNETQRLEKLEKSFKSLSEHPGWAHLKMWIEEKQRLIKNFGETTLTGHETPAEIGFRYLLASLSCEKLQDIIDAVEETQVVEDKGE